MFEGKNLQEIGPSCSPELTKWRYGHRKVRRNSLLRNFEGAGGVNPSEQAVQLGQHAWSNGKSALLVRVPARLGAWLSDYFAEFLGFARLRPNTVGFIPR